MNVDLVLFAASRKFPAGILYRHSDRTLLEQSFVLSCFRSWINRVEAGKCPHPGLMRSIVLDHLMSSVGVQFDNVQAFELICSFQRVSDEVNL